MERDVILRTVDLEESLKIGMRLGQDGKLREYRRLVI
jgi:hypothetical protein